MPYVTRDENNSIVALFKESQFEEQEYLPENAVEVRNFIGLNENVHLETSDLGMARVLEDLIDLLISKHVIMLTELPIDAQSKLLKRQKTRQGLSNGDLLF